jgi:hypothetical protein
MAVGAGKREKRRNGDMKFEPYKLYSLLDILGASVVCDGCETETDKTLTPEMAFRKAEESGWQLRSASGGKDLCPRCKKAAA